MSLGSCSRSLCFSAILLGHVWIGDSRAGAIAPQASGEQSAVTYFIDCNGGVGTGAGSQGNLLHSIAQVNALALHAGDSLLFKRGSTCQGEMEPQGSGTNEKPIHVGAFGSGPLPRIVARASEESALRFYNQSFWEISSLDLVGGTTYGFYAGGDAKNLQHLHLRDMRIHDVRGALKHKESGLVVIRASTAAADYDDVELDGVDAFNTTQWAGILILGASHVRVRNSTVHDVQGDGIVVFRSHDAVISRSLAWHTGMQHQLTIGTPNAIWTWNCTDCTVEENEVFLTDSPGIDGGAFDIDFGNTRNTVRRNFAHDTAGYCVSVFGAFGPTTRSVVAENVCLNNGMSPRLAQRQGAVLLMTWQGGSLDGVEIRDNRIYWDPPGDTPAVQTGEILHASGLVLGSNEIWSSAPSFIDSTLAYAGDHNRFLYFSRDAADGHLAMPAALRSHETDSTFVVRRDEFAGGGRFGVEPRNIAGWRLELSVPPAMIATGNDADLRSTLVQLRSAALQFGHCGLQVMIREPVLSALAEDWALISDGVQMREEKGAQEFSLKLISPAGNLVREWHAYPSPTDLGLMLRQNVGTPDYGRLPFEEVRARD